MNVNGTTGCDSTKVKVQIQHSELKPLTSMILKEEDGRESMQEAGLVAREEEKQNQVSPTRGFQDGGYHQGAEHCWKRKKDGRAGAGDYNMGN